VTWPPPARGPIGHRLYDLRRATARHRRLLAAGLAAGSVAAGLSALAPAGPASVGVLVAARDLPGGRALRGDDLRQVALPAVAVPDGALRPGADVSGRLLAAPVRRGEPLTDVRLAGPALLSGYADAGQDVVATTVRIADAGAVALIRPGDVVDVLAAAVQPGEPDTGSAAVVAAGVRVLTVPGAGELSAAGGQPAMGDGALVVLATSPQIAGVLARAAVTSRLSLTVRPQ
jgi:pilus assembly protein CpaB